MPDYRAIAIPMFADNYLWLLADDRDRILIVDPGDARPVLRMAAEGYAPQAIVVTHHHSDHIGGLGELLAEFDIPCYAPADARIPHAQQRVGEADVLRIDSMALEVQVLAVPGHTSSHLAYVAADHLFCGDTLFSLGCGRLFEGSPQTMLGSLDRLAALPEHTRVCCAHEYTLANGRFAIAAEPSNAARDAWLESARERLAAGEPSLPSRIGIERACNPFLRSDQPGLQAALAANDDIAPLDRLTCFTRLRRWKDSFQ